MITVKTFPNILVPIIKPTLKNANFAPNILVKKKDIKINKKNITDENKILLLINLDLHKKS